MSPYYEPSVRAYPYDPDAARRSLADAGWTLDGDGVLVSPDGSRVPAQKLLCPTASVAPTTAELASRAADALSAIGIPTSTEPMDFSAMLSRIDERDFQMYVLAWQMTRDPDSLYALYSSKMDIPGGSNLPGISNPELDAVLNRLRFAPDATTALDAASDAQALLAELAPVAPIYSRYSVSAVRRDWKGVLVTDRVTADNIWSLLSMEPASGPMRPLYLVQEEEPRALNPFTSTSAYDWQVMGLVYDSLIAVDPYTLETIPWLAKSWKVETEDDGDGPHTVLTFLLREGEVARRPPADVARRGLHLRVPDEEQAPALLRQRGQHRPGRDAGRCHPRRDHEERKLLAPAQDRGPSDPASPPAGEGERLEELASGVGEAP